MSKTKEQVNRYLTHCKFPEDDWNKILLYCRKNGLGYAHKAPHPKSQSTFVEFIEWLSNGHGSGEVVRYGHTLGILSTCTPDYSELCAYYSYDGQLVVSDLRISTDKIMPSTDNDVQKLYGELRMSGMDFDERLCRIHKRFLPKPYMKIAYRRGGKPGYGVIDCYQDQSAHFVFGVENGVLMQDFSVPIIELSTSTIDKEGVSAITATLNASLLRWNATLNKLEKIQSRAGVGGTYWYVTDKFTIASAVENGTPTCEARYKRGNYFVNHSEASDFLESIIDFRKRMINK